MTGLQFKEYVIAKLKRLDKDTEIYQATTDIVADMRIRHPFEDYKEESTTSSITTLGDYELPLPADFGYLLGHVGINDGNPEQDFLPLAKISKAEYDRLYPDRLFTDKNLVNKSRPARYCIYANKIYLGPVPDKLTYIYTINYSTEEFEEIDADTTEVPFTDRYRNVLRSGVLKEVFNGMENYDESTYWESEYLKGLTLMVDRENANTASSSGIQYRGL